MSAPRIFSVFDVEIPLRKIIRAQKLRNSKILSLAKFMNSSLKVSLC